MVNFDGLSGISLNLAYLLYIIYLIFDNQKLLLYINCLFLISTPMRISLWTILGILIATIGFSHAAIYLDELNDRNLTDSQNTTGTSGTNLIPASKPIVLDEITITTTGKNTPSTTAPGWSTSGILIIEDTSEESEDTNPINQLPDLQRDAEFLMSLRWLYDQWITKFQDPEKFMPENYLSRIDAAKMLSILSRKVFGNSKLNSEACAYTDISSYEDITKGQVKDACQLGIFKSAALFNPNIGITKGQLIAVLIRMFDHRLLDENTTPWYKNYVQRWWEIWLLPDRSTASMDETVSRLDVSKMLYKLRNIYLNKNPIGKNETPLFIKILSTSNSGAAYQAIIDVDMIRNDSLETLEMKLDPVTYYFSKDKVYNYGVTLSSFQVYGYIYTSSESITPIGVGTWRVQQWVIQEWSLVIWGTPQTIYTIKPNQDASLYLINKAE